MVGIGAEGSDAEFAAILNYLAKNYGAGNASPSSPGPAASLAVPPPSESPNDAGAPGGTRTAEAQALEDRKNSKRSTPVRRSRQQKNGPRTVTIPAANASRRSRS